METISVAEALEVAFNALISDRLVLLAGAGLSMAPPSSLPSAAVIAFAAKTKYDSIHGTRRPPLADSIVEQAEFFFRNGELASIYFRTLIDFSAFAGRSNPGHEAIADLLLVRALRTAVTTNVDTLIEAAGQYLFGHIGVGIDGNTVASLPPDVAPLLKVHGCRQIDPNNMVWAPSQMAVPPVSERIQTSANWLASRLVNCDLLVIGYATDWDYLNGIISSTLGAVNPAKVIVVDTASASAFEEKAPELYAVGQRAATAFLHVQASGADFLGDLRRRFSESFVRQVLHSGKPGFVDLFGVPPDAELLEPPAIDNTTFWEIRRDLEGRMPGEPAANKSPPADDLLGLTILRLRAAGAEPDGRFWRICGQRVLVLRAAGKLLHHIKAAFEREFAPSAGPDIIAAVGAESYALPANVARATTVSTITRGSSARWMTHGEALTELIPCSP